MKSLRLGTRGSALALKQAEMTEAALVKAFPDLEVERVIIKTTGDRRTDVALNEVAKAEGVDLRDEDATSFYKTLDIIAEDGKTSMLQDIEASRKTELEMFAPVVIKLGDQHGIPTPVNRTVLSVICSLEKQYLAHIDS